MLFIDDAQIEHWQMMTLDLGVSNSILAHSWNNSGGI